MRQRMIVNRFVGSANPIALRRASMEPLQTQRPFSREVHPVITVWIGTAAAVASTVSFTPQAWKIIKTAETDDISAIMYSITVGAFALWTVYGVLLRQWPLVVSNVICFFLSAFILTMRLLPRAAKRKVRRSVEERS